MPYIGLINNTALLLVMGVLYGSLRSRRENLGSQLVSGLVLGMIVVAVMLNPWELAPGIFFDTRTIVLSVGGLFLGLIPTSVAMSLGALYRIYAGGAGTLTGVLWIVVAGLLGICWGKMRPRPSCHLSGWEFYLFGVVVQCCMLLLMLTMPSHLVAHVLRQISLPTLLIFPVGTFILAKLLAGQDLQHHSNLALDKSERQYRELVHYSQAIILRLDLQGRCLFFNEYAENFFGFDKDQVLGRSLMETIVPVTDSTGRNLHKYFSAFVKNPQAFPVHENENICRDGRRVQILWNNVPVYDESGKVVAIQGIGHDVTEQRRAEASLRAAEKQFHQLIEVSPVPLAIQEQGRVVYVNRKFVEMFGYTLEEIPTLDHWWLLAYPDEGYRESVKRAWHVAAEEGSAGLDEFEPQEFRVTCKDGSVRDILFMVSSIGGQNLVVFNDMTRERTVDRMKSEFIAIAAHELNTPLTTIAGFTEILLEGEHFDWQQRREYLSIIYEKTEVLNRLIEDLLNIGRVESGRGIRLEIETCDIYEVISASVLSYRKEFPARQIRLEWPETWPRAISIDAGKIGQVMNNLLSNSVKYSSEAGEILVGAVVSAREINVFVRDEGVGMTPEQVSRIFERFYRVDVSDTSVPGMGLGMAIVKNIIDAHGGHIRVDSEPDKGTTVSFTLPLIGPSMG
jgi:PAS domain S-box-containing protein